MSSLLGGGGGAASLARIAFETTGVGQVTQDIDRVERSYREGLSGMSDAAIKAELAQDRLQRSLRKGPSAFRDQARAELALRRETDSLTRSQERSTRGFASMRRGLLMYTGALLGGAGLVAGIRGAIQAASNLEEQQSKTEVTFRESGAQVVEWSRSTAASMGIARDQALQYASTLGGILNVSGLARDESAKLSMEFVQLAADMASFNNVPIDQALEALRAGLVGEAEPLRRLQVLLSETRVKQAAYTAGIAKTGAELTEQQKVLARYQVILKDTADQQGDYARTSEGLENSLRTLSALWREAQVLVGQALAPAVTEVVHGLRDWLSESENQKQLQRDINKLVGDSVTIIRSLAAVLKFAKDAASPLVEAVGGLGNAIRIMGAAWLAFKAKAVLGFAGTALASRTTSAKMVADAAVAGRAWDVATRPRVMPVTTVGGGIPGAAGRGGGARGAAGRVAGAAARWGPLVAYTTAYIALTRDKSGDPKNTGKTVPRGMRNAGMAIFWRPDMNAFTYGLTDEVVPLTVLIAVGIAKAPKDPIGTRGDRNRPNMGRAVPGGGSTASDTSAARPRRTIADILLDEARASGTATETDDLRFKRERRDRIQAQIDNLERRKTLTDKQKAELTQLYGSLASVEGEIDAIITAGEAKIIAAREAAAAKREAARKAADERRRKAEEAEDRRLDQFERRTRNRDLARAARFDPRAGFGGALGGASMKPVDKAAKSAQKSPAEEARDLQRAFKESTFQFLTDLRGTMNQLGGNLHAPGSLSVAGAPNPELFRILSELRDQTYFLRDLASGVKHPGTRYAREEIDAAFDGSTF